MQKAILFRLHLSKQYLGFAVSRKNRHVLIKLLLFLAEPVQFIRPLHFRDLGALQLIMLPFTLLPGQVQVYSNLIHLPPGRHELLLKHRLGPGQFFHVTTAPLNTPLQVADSGCQSLLFLLKLHQHPFYLPALLACQSSIGLELFLFGQGLLQPGILFTDFFPRTPQVMLQAFPLFRKASQFTRSLFLLPENIPQLLFKIYNPSPQFLLLSRSFLLFFGP